MCTAATRSGHFVTRFTVVCLQISLDVFWLQQKDCDVFHCGVLHRSYGRNKKWTVWDTFHCGVLTDLLRCEQLQQEVDSL